jgi:serine/threonine protein kinase
MKPTDSPANGPSLKELSQPQYDRLMALWDESVEMADAERDAWLAALERSEPKVASLLRALSASLDESRGRRFLETSDRVSSHVAALLEADPGLIGRQYGPYRVLALLGHGGMGSVWLAERVDGLFARQVALKLVHPALIGRVMTERFSREREILASLNHPNIARLLDAGFAEDGQPYLALDHVAGTSLTAYCDERRLSIRARLELFGQVLGAVQYAHAHLVIHRDLKPANILVTAEGQVQLLDFGIAKLLTEGQAQETELTRMGGRALTPDYAAPEQIAGASITTAADVYALGVMLHELLTGERPYKLTRDSRGALEEAILKADPVAPSRAALSEAAAAARSSNAKKLSSTFRGDLDTITAKALKKSPSERYPTANAFGEDIARYLRGDVVLAQPDRVTYRALKFARRHWAGLTATGVLLLTLAAGLAATSYEAKIASAQRDRAVALAGRNQAANDFLSSLITRATQADKPVTVEEMLERSEALAKGTLGGNPDQLASVLLMLGANYHTMGKDKRAEPLFDDALSAARGSSDRDLRAEIACEHALVIANLGRSDEAKRTLQSVIADSSIGPLVSANCLQDRAYIAQNESNAIDALRFGKLAWERLQQAADVTADKQGEFLGSLGYAAFLSGNNVEANRYYADAMARFAAHQLQSSASAISVRNNWAIVSDGSGTPRTSLMLYEEALAASRQYGAESAPPPYLLGNWASALENLGRYRAARAGYQECASESQKVGNPAATIYCLLGLASCERELGNLAAATEYLNQAALAAKSMPDGSPPATALKIMRGRIALSENRLNDARAALTEAIGNRAASSVPGRAWLTRAEVELAQGDLAAATADAQQALSSAQALQRGVPHSNRSGLAWLMLGRVKAATGDANGAHLAFEAAVEHLSDTVDADHPALQMARRLLQVDRASPQRSTI